ncbi:MAG: hypothetical protein OEX04_11355 [Acidimicrobiia bacterium]|nr:hypothetical protein [Acidimicrobiia bacterium]MDH4308064.1 hypothetical protein [Acidimicrobiia bacterium]
MPEIVVHAEDLVAAAARLEMSVGDPPRVQGCSASPPATSVALAALEQRIGADLEQLADMLGRLASELRLSAAAYATADEL